MKKLLLAIFIALIVSCNADVESNINIEKQYGKYDYLPYEAYHIKGPDTTICFQDTARKFNQSTEKWDLVILEHCKTRQWELDYGRTDVWYWDKKSQTWYTFNRDGMHWTFKWIDLHSISKYLD